MFEQSSSALWLTHCHKKAELVYIYTEGCQRQTASKLPWTWQSPCAVPAGRCCHRPLHALARIRQPRETSAWRRAEGPGSGQPAEHRYRPVPRQHQPRARPKPGRTQPRPTGAVLSAAATSRHRAPRQSHFRQCHAHPG